MLNRLLNIGTSNDLEKYFNDKIQITNLVCILFAVLALPFFIITWQFFYPIVLIPMAFIAVSVLGIILNYFRIYNLARFAASTILPALGIIYIGFIQPDNEPLFASLYALLCVFVLPSWLVYDFREKARLLTTVAISVIAYASIQVINNSLSIDFENVYLFENGWMVPLCFATFIIFLSGVLYFLLHASFVSEKGNEKLIEDATIKADQLLSNEQKLNEYIKEVEESQTADEKRNWASEGIAKASTILRSDKDGQKLYDEITSYITEYLKANQGGLFLVDNDGDDDSAVLRLSACYAYSRKKHTEKEIQPGQGLVGQAYLEKSSIYLRDVPNDYTRITSGLGESTPSEVLIVPLIINEEVEGVFEFASFNHFEDYQIEFLEHLGETLAAFINVNRINEKTKILLEESRMQAESMKSQEEEMRQNMEELSTTQEQSERLQREMSESVSELEGKMNIINKGSLVSKTDRKGIITYVNDFFCEAAGYTREELIGQNHNIVRHSDMPKAVYKEIWSTIGSGKVWNGKVKNRTKNEGYYWVEANIGPVMGDDGKPKEYVGVRYLISEYVDNDKIMEEIHKTYKQ